jgi:hypothetical protein
LLALARWPIGRRLLNWETIIYLLLSYSPFPLLKQKSSHSALSYTSLTTAINHSCFEFAKQINAGEDLVFG